ncbi:hypothetical protein [Sphingobacterium paucimobilis]|uniref:Uncharacterized protein n=1 Tax=Sphingobacterium paucimobilis HER1398 TaxID=1346330 RepID=U2J4H2_9SPHI|nr:hypothetical protein [Sphingobacterium paucimobilis]ERJ59854.1 hypothetical protein M472_13870 [Sphingobacterium paucimobilis HER1398]
MKKPIIKKRNIQDNYYSHLQSRSLDRIIELSGNLWTDHNVHDPGITIADYLNYGLYDIYFRQLFSLENYLFKNLEDKDYSQKGLQSREQLYTFENPSGIRVDAKVVVTEQDYEELFVDFFGARVSGVEVYYNKIDRSYDIFLQRNSGYDRSGIYTLEKEVKALYHKNRNLGENLGNVFHFAFSQVPNKNLYQSRKYRHHNSYDFPTFSAQEDMDESKLFTPDYQTIQYDFPELYGISKRGIPSHEDPDYKARVLQLKGYLLNFDYLMANHLQKMDSVHQLFDIGAVVPTSRIANVQIVNGEEIIDEKKQEAAAIAFQKERFNSVQKFAYLNMLDAIYDENTQHLFGSLDTDSLNSKRARLISRLPQLNEHRFRACNIYDPNSICSLQDLLEEIISLRFTNRRPFHFRGVRVISNELFKERYKSLLLVDEQYYYQSIPVIVYPIAESDEDVFGKMKDMLSLIWHAVLPEDILIYGTDVENYKLKVEGDDYSLLFRSPTGRLEIEMSLLCSDSDIIIEQAYLFIHFIRQMNRMEHQQRFYFIEYILLGQDDDKDLISIVYPKDLIDPHNTAFQIDRFLDEFLYDRFPVHLRYRLHGLAQDDLENFHITYAAWRRAMAVNDGQAATVHAAVLTSFLNIRKAS